MSGVIVDEVSLRMIIRFHHSMGQASQVYSYWQTRGRGKQITGRKRDGVLNE